MTSPKTAFLSGSLVALHNSDEYIKITQIADYGEPKIQMQSKNNVLDGKILPNSENADSKS